jgi:hypothetical protein
MKRAPLGFLSVALILISGLMSVPRANALEGADVRRLSPPPPAGSKPQDFEAPVQSKPKAIVLPRPQSAPAQRPKSAGKRIRTPSASGQTGMGVDAARAAGSPAR